MEEFNTEELELKTKKATTFLKKKKFLQVCQNL